MTMIEHEYRLYRTHALLREAIASHHRWWYGSYRRSGFVLGGPKRDTTSVVDSVQHSPLTSTCEAIAADGMKPVTRTNWLWRRRQNAALAATKRRRTAPKGSAITWL